MKNIYLIALMLVVSCGRESSSTGETKRIKLDSTGDVEIILTGVANIPSFKELARSKGLRVEGESILFLQGDSSTISSLDIPVSENFAYHQDEEVKAEKSAPFRPDQSGLYLAKKDFGIDELNKYNPKADGRGVIVGVLDDGISPNQDGFILTSTGERKFLKKNSQSTFTTFDLVETEDGYKATIDETRTGFSGKVDLDQNGKFESYEIQVDKELTTACWLDQCKKSFSASGDFFTSKNPLIAVMIEIDKENKKLQIFQPEVDGDSHGEGVASVLAGHRIGNLDGFDGVAPGAKIVDYDLSEETDKAEENAYTIKTFLKALDWFGSEGVEVANISYSLYFTSVKGQTFMRKALGEIIKKHNMVISFSAGNNGPGLGSLNRRSIYPDSSLVAGAYVSKELDERVHGVTGIPDEGRVIYYSSRGPGQGTGPTLIAPLSSLTNSTADAGHRAFNGTSSASPALAGAATVLISAIKQEGLKVHAPTVVHALRLSGKRLKNEPFVFQGNGLPQLKDALEIYKKMVQGDLPENVVATVSGEAIDGVAARGFTLKKSTSTPIETRIISLSGTVSEMAPTSKQINLLTPVKISYSKGIEGPRELWVSRSSVTLSVDVDTEEVLGDKNEAFGEIKVLSQDGLHLTTIPVTVVNDININERPSQTVKVAAQEGKRIHLNIPEGVKTFKVNSEVLDNPSSTVQISVYDTNQIRAYNVRVGNEILVEVDRAGHYQIGIALDRGSKRGAVVKVEARPVDLKLTTKYVAHSNQEIKLQNLSSVPMNGILSLQKAGEVVSQSIFGLKDSPITELTLAPGKYQIRTSPLEEYDLSYFSTNCSTTAVVGEETKLTSSKTLDYDKEATVKIRCVPFDHGVAEDSAIHWKVQVLKVEKATTYRLDIGARTSRTLKFKDLEKGIYTLQYQDPLNAGNSFEVGKFEIL